MSTAPSTGSAASSDTCADVAERLFGEFEASHGLAAISRVVQRCRTDQAAVPSGTSHETLEELCRRRLAGRVSTPPPSAGTDPATSAPEPFAPPGS